MPDVAAGRDRAESACRFVEVWMRCRIRSAATIWYGRMTSSLRSTSKTQYLVRTFSSVCLAKNVFVNADQVGDRLVVRVGPPARELEAVRGLLARPLAAGQLADVPVAGGVAVVLRQRAVADHEQLYVLEQPRVGPEAVALVAVDLVERLADVDTAALQLDVHHRQAVDEDRHVVAVARAPLAAAPRTG